MPRGGDARGAAPAREAVIEILTAYAALREVEPAGRSDLLEWENMLVDGPAVGHPGIEDRL